MVRVNNNSLNIKWPGVGYVMVVGETSVEKVQVEINEAKSHIIKSSG